MHKRQSKIEVEFFPDNISSQVSPGQVLSTIIEKLNIDLLFPCGGKGSCGKCVVQFEQSPPPPTYAEELFFTPNEIKDGYRLACQCKVSVSSRIRIPEETRSGKMVLLKEGKVSLEKINPLVEIHHLKISAPTLTNLKSDERLLEAALYKKVKAKWRISAYMLRLLPIILRQSSFQVAVVTGDHEVLDIVRGNLKTGLFGVALDLGTTTLVVSIYDLQSGKTIGVEAALNPNIKYGEDLISRVTYITDDRMRLLNLQRMLIRRINKMIVNISRKHKISKNHIYIMTVAGNAVMNHLFLGINPKTIALAPYTPVFNDIKREKIRLLNLSAHPEGLLYVLPNLGGFVGGDVVADMLVAGFGVDHEKTRLLIDIGTNCEVVLEKAGKCFAASSPAGPALEGANITYGMRAESGAIYDVQLNKNNMQLLTIDNRPACGICGSGLFHLVEILVKLGIIASDGKISAIENITDKSINKIFAHRIKMVNGMKAILLANTAQGAKRDIFLTQSDIRHFQLAKSAIVSAWNILCKEMKCDPQEIDEVFIAGAFGNYIRPDTALGLGLVPNIGLNSIHFIGNAALAGARMILLNKKNLKIVQRLAYEIKFIELAGREDFQDAYITNLSL
jgi:uncharacterized 2Fe-2S/4Fe-4S cluster protein (DUF4445 family)